MAGRRFATYLRGIGLLKFLSGERGLWNPCICNYELFSSLGYRASPIHDTTTSIDDVIDSSKASILRFGYDDSFYQHYVAIQPVVYNGLTTYRVYNEKEGATTYRTLTSIDAWMKEEGHRFMNLTTVK